MPSKYVLRWARWFRTLGDPNRLEIFRWLARHSPATVTDVVREFRLSQPLVSHHLKRLRDEGLARKDDERIWAGHRVDPETLEHLGRELSRLSANAREEGRMAADERRRQRRGVGLGLPDPGNSPTLLNSLLCVPENVFSVATLSPSAA